MLSPDLPLKLSAAGIRLTGYVIESNLRVARVFGQAALGAGAFSGSLRAKAAQPCAKKEAPAKVKLASQNNAPLPQVDVPVPKPVAKKPALASDNAKSERVAEIKSAPLAEAKPATVVEPKTETVAKTEPAPVAKEKPATRRAAETTKSTVMPDSATPTSPAKAAEQASIKRPRAPSMPPALPEPVKKTKAE